MDYRAQRRPTLRLLTIVDLCAVVVPCLLVWNGQLTSADSLQRQHHRMVGVPVDRTLNEQDVSVQQLLADAVPPHVLSRKPQDSDFRPRDHVAEALMKSTGTSPSDAAIGRQMPHGAVQDDEVIGQLLRQQAAFNPDVDDTNDDVEDDDYQTRSKKKVHFGFHAMRGRRSPARTVN